MKTMHVVSTGKCNGCKQAPTVQPKMFS